MGRASWGAAQDLSGTFSFLYNQSIAEAKDLALRAERRAKEAQAAADQDAINKWRDGAMSDEEFRAYASQRATATAGGSDPDLAEYWANTLRDFESSILAETISLETERIQDEIAEGRATWDDLKNYLESQAATLPAGSPLGDQLRQQIGEVNDRVRDSRIGGEFAKIEYLFRSDQITGQDAAQQMRALADKYYKNTDPDQYYQILQAALQFDEYGSSLYSTGLSRSSGGGGGGGGGSALTDDEQLKWQIDNMEGTDKIFQNLVLQAKNQQATGSFTYVDENGVTRIEEIPLRDETGALIPDIWSQIRDQYLTNIDALIVANDARCRLGNGPACTARDNWSLTKTKVITTDFQPLNDEDVQQQGDLLLDNAINTLRQGANSTDPNGSWGATKTAFDALTTYNDQVNTAGRVSRGRVAEGEDAGAPVWQQIEDAVQNQTTPGMDLKAQALAEVAQIIKSGKPFDPAMLVNLLAPWLGVEQAVTVAQDAVATQKMMTGLSVPPNKDGTPGKGAWAWVYDPTVQSLVPKPLGESVSVIPGAPPTMTPQDTDEWGDPVGVAQGTTYTPGLLQLGAGKIANGYIGRPTDTNLQLVRDPSAPGGWRPPVDQDEWDSATESGSGFFDGTYMFVVDLDGTPHVWFQGDDGTWHKDKIRVNPRTGEAIGGVPTPAITDNTRDSQRETQRQATRSGVDPSAQAYYSFHDEFRAKTGLIEGTDGPTKPPLATDKKDWFDATAIRDRRDSLMTSRAEIFEGPNTSPLLPSQQGTYRPSGGGVDDSIISRLRASADALTRTSGVLEGVDSSSTPAPIPAPVVAPMPYTPPPLTISPIRPPTVSGGFQPGVEPAPPPPPPPPAIKPPSITYTGPRPPGKGPLPGY
jgi:hypothetical protein